MKNEDRFALARFTTPEEDERQMPAVFILGFLLGVAFAIIAGVAVFGG